MASSRVMRRTVNGGVVTTFSLLSPERGKIHGTVTQRRTLGTVVGDVHHRGAEPIKNTPNVCKQLLMQMIVKSGEWFVEQHHTWLPGHGARQCHTFCLTSGQLGHSSMCKTRQTESREPFLGDVPSLSFCRAAHTKGIRDIVGDVEVGKQLIVLEHQPDVALMCRSCGDVTIGDANGATLDVDEAGNRIQQRGLSASTRAVHRQPLTRLHRERDAIQYAPCTALHCEINDLEHAHPASMMLQR